MNPSFDHLKTMLQNPGLAPVEQKRQDAYRLDACEKAYRARPHFLPIIHTLPAAADSVPVAEATEPLNHDVILHGAITDGESRNCKIYKGDVEAPPIIRFGSQAGLKLSLDAIAGHSVASAGLDGVYRWAEPSLLSRTDVVTLEIYQENSPGGGGEQVATVLCGERVFRSNAEEATLPDKVRKNIIEHIKRRPAPEARYAVIQVAFDADGNANVETPRADEPLMVLGFRLTFTDATINLGFDGDSSFSKSKFPIWALCSEPGNRRQLYQMLKSPLLIPSQVKLLLSLFNQVDSIAGTFATDGNIEVLMRTV